MFNTNLFCISVFASAIVMLFACKDNAQIPDAEVTLSTSIHAERIDAKRYVLSNSNPLSYEVEVLEFHSTGDLSKFKSTTLPAGTIGSPSEISISVPDPGKRYFFILKNKLDTAILSERRLLLSGADNFRDLGGLPATDGKHIRWGLFFRADKLSELSTSDLDYVSNLGLATVVDLRSEQEVADAPDVLPKGAEYLHFPIYNEAEDTSDIKGQILNGQFGVEDANQLLVEVNRLFASSEAYRFQEFMNLFKSGNGVPVVYHCTSGKDRTGFATYLILHTLGVDSATIFDDYLMSNFYRYERNKRNLRLANLGQYVKSVNPEVVKPLMLVDPKYLGAAVSEIKRQYGSVDAFMEKQYGITDSIRNSLRERCLF